MSFVSCKDYAAIEKEYLKTRANNEVLNIFQIGDNPASNAYIKGKIKDCNEVGIKSVLYKLPETITEQELIKKIDSVSGAVILQLPVPPHINAEKVIENSITPAQDVDGFLVNSNHYPCTPKGIIDWLNFNSILLEGKNIVMIGRSNIVGKPLAKMFTNANATVTLCHSKTKDIESYCKMADIIVVAIGQPKWLHFNVEKDKKPIIIDVGINRVNGKLCGDVDYDYMTAQGCYVTPVPGGVGLLTRLALLENTINQ